MDITPIVLALLMPLTIITPTDLGIRIILDLLIPTVWYMIIRIEGITYPHATAIQFTIIIIEIEVENNNTYANGRRNFDRPGRYNHYKGGRYEVNKNYQPSRRRTSVAVASKPIINRTRPINHTKLITNHQNPRGNRLVNNLNTKPTVTGSHRFRSNRNTILNGRKVSSHTNMNIQNRTTRYSSSKTSNIASNTKRSQQVK